MLTYQTKLLNKQKLSFDVWKFDFEKPENFKFEAGQFVMVKVNEENGKPIFRAYSICSLPQENILSTAVKLIPNGTGSKFLDKLNQNDKVEIRGPMGKFLVKIPSQKHIFLASGIGITPFIPMIDLCIKNNQKCHLYYGNKTKSETVFDEYFENLSKEFPQIFEYSLFLSREENEAHLQGRITHHLPNKELSDEDQYYICGGKEMIDEVRQILLEKGIPKDNIHKEAFY